MSNPAEKRRKAFHIISHAGLYDALHALQDSYSPAHTDRSETTFSIMEVRAWDVTNMDVCGLLGLSNGSLRTRDAGRCLEARLVVTAESAALY